jgi:putative transposase
MVPSTKPSYAGYRVPPEVISHAIRLSFRFPLSLRMVEEMPAARGILVRQETVRPGRLKFGQALANPIRRRLPRPGDPWHLDEVGLTVAGQKHGSWRAVDQDGLVLDVLMQSRREPRAAKRLLRKLLRKRGRPPRVLVTDKLASYPAAKRALMPGVEHAGTRASTTGPRTRTSRRDDASGR